MIRNKLRSLEETEQQKMRNTIKYNLPLSMQSRLILLPFSFALFLNSPSSFILSFPSSFIQGDGAANCLLVSCLIFLHMNWVFSLSYGCLGKVDISLPPLQLSVVMWLSSGQWVGNRMMYATLGSNPWGKEVCSCFSLIPFPTVEMQVWWLELEQPRWPTGWKPHVRVEQENESSLDP